MNGHSEAPGVDEFHLRIAGVEDRDGFHPVTGFDKFDRQRQPIFNSMIVKRFELFRQVSYYQTVKYHRVAHIGEIFHPVKIIVVPHVAGDDFHFPVSTSKHIDLRQRWGGFLFRSHISPDDTAPLLDRIPEMTNLSFEIAVARLQRSVNATASRVVSPAMIRAHETVFSHLCVFQRSQPMGTTYPQQTGTTFAIAKYH